ncbi:hypothetical protein YTPLAS18_33440 [Nitrospira sp.]|nr:hypothetical protein YTPLAS18_33440 [Nitrospira sp.]
MGEGATVMHTMESGAEHGQTDQSQRDASSWIGRIFGGALSVILATATLTACIGGGGSPPVSSSAANLSSLEILDGTQVIGGSPAFTAETTGYSVAVGGATASVNLRAVTSDPKATLRINNVVAISGQLVGPISLNPGVNSITVSVDVPGASKVYVVSVSRGINANLAALVVSSGSLVPALSPRFDPDVTFYSVTVGSAVSSISLTGTTADSTATLEVNNAPALSGQPVGPIILQLGPNPPISIKVTALGATKTYSLVITRSPNTNLAALQVSAGILTPALDPLQTNYTVTTPYATTSTTVTATAADTFATLLINGQAVTSGQASPPINLAVGQTTIDIIVSAPTVTPTTYKLIVTRLPASINANLSNLTLSAGALNPTFTTNTTDYTVATPNTTTTTTVTATVADSTATITINGVATPSGSASTPINLNPGDNLITIQVTPQSGASGIKTYRVTVARSGNPNLSTLALSAGPLTPAFNASTRSYAVNNVPTTTLTTTVTATVSESASTLTVNGSPATSGSAFGPILLNPGVNSISVVVTAAGNVSRTYTVIVNVDTGSDLSNLTVSAGSLVPVFSPTVSSYSVNTANSTTSTTVTAAAANGAVISINGVITPSGMASAPIPLAIGDNTITIVVTPVVGAQRTYTVIVTRAASTNSDLSNLVISAGALSPSFSSNTTNYTVNVPNGTLTTMVTALLADAVSTLTVNGSPALSGAAFGPILLNIGPNVITIAVTPQTGPTKDYVVTVNRNSADLLSLTLSTGTVDVALTPVFSSGQLAYTATAPLAASQVIVTPVPAVLGSTITVNGNPSTVPVPLVGPSTTITIVVTPGTGPPTTTYTVTVSQ